MARPMKKYRVRYWIDITVEAKTRDEACELAGREIEHVRPQDLNSEPVKRVQNRVKRKYHFTKDDIIV